MCKKKESLHVTIEFGKDQVSNLLWVAWTSENHKTDLIQKEKKSRWNNKVCQNDLKIYRDIQNRNFPFQVDENYSNQIFHSNFWIHLKRIRIRKKTIDYPSKWWRIPQVNNYQTFKIEKDIFHSSKNLNRN